MMRVTLKAAAFLLVAGFALTACDDDPSDPAVPVPTNVRVTASTPTSVTISFDAVASATRYVIERGTGAAPSAFDSIGGVAAGATSLTIPGLQAETTYQFRVRAITARGTSQPSTAVPFTTTSRARLTINANITANRTLSPDTIYTLSGYIHVSNGATLTIPAGTRIEGALNPRGSSLFVLAGSRLVATGTANNPVVFTSAQPVGQRKAGDWGGIVFIGNATTNRATSTVEGTGGGSAVPLLQYPAPGANDNSDSGTLNYVRIEYAGYALVTGNELNSVSFYAVGRETDVDFVQVLNGLDDGFEWFGGTVDGKHLVSYETGDDHFDMSEGFRGRLQYLIAYTSLVLDASSGAGSVSSEPHGIENDGCSGAGCTNSSTPFTTPIVANFTLVSRNVVGTGTGEIGMVLRRGTGGYYVNGVLSRWARAAISIRDTATANRIASGDLLLSNIAISESPTTFEQGASPIVGNPAIDTTALNVRRVATAAAGLFTLFPAATPTSAAAFDWTPSATASIRTGGLTTFTGRLATANAGNFVTPTTYLGAADPAGAKWWLNWTAYTPN